MTNSVTLTSDAVYGIIPPGTMLAPLLPAEKVVRLGRVTPMFLNTRRTLAPQLLDHVDLGAATLPGSTNYREKAKVSLNRVYMNDRYGDCVIARQYHNHGVWCANDATECTGSDYEVQKTYQDWCGHLGNDAGCIIQEVLNKAKTDGIPMNGVRHKIDGYANVDNRNKELVKAAIHLFGGGMSFGVNLPSEWTSASVWDVTNSQIVGGHDIAPVDYDEKGVYISSWGNIYLMTWNAVISTRWIEEAWVCLAPDWYNNDKLSPNGVDVAALKVALTSIGNGVIPNVDPATTTTTPMPIPPSQAGYTVVQNVSLSGLITAVGEMLQKGWKVSGNWQPYQAGNTVLYTQTMVK